MRLILDKIKAKGYVGEKEVEGIASRLRIPSSRVFGFISQFDELPQRPYRARIRVCTGPACADAGAWAILEDLNKRAPSGVEILADPGILRWHSPPAACIETPGDGARLAEGLGPDDTTALVAALTNGDLSAYKPMKDISPPRVEAVDGREPAPWTAAVEEGTLPDSWGPDLIRRVSEQPEGVIRRIVGNAVQGEYRDRGRPPPVLLCDSAGPGVENSVSFAASLLHPRAVVAGSALAAAACGARKLVFYVPCSEAEAEEVLASAASELLSGVGIKHAFFRGPVGIPCAWDIGRAAVTSGMMLWRAASLYGWKGTRDGDPSLAVLDAELAWRLPWMLEKRSAKEEGWEGNRLISLAGMDAKPRLLEIQPGVGLQDILDGMQGSGGEIKAVYLGGITASVTTPLLAGRESLEDVGEIVLLDGLTCMPRWALYLAWFAERACCGGCVPGRTAPAAAARLIQRILRAEAGEETMEDLGALLTDAGGLALCPRLSQRLNPILDCLRGFGDEFRAHAREGACVAGSCSPAAEAVTHGG